MTASNKNNIAEPEPGAKIKTKKGNLGGQWPITPKEKTLRKNPCHMGRKTQGKNLTKKPAQTKMDTVLCIILAVRKTEIRRVYS